jgi:glycerophosphoryl diester phosphodiesterase
MSETKAAAHEQGATWARYRHRERPDIEFDVEVSARGNLVVRHEPISGEPCYHRIRTIRNLSHHEEAHQPAYTYMPTDRFLNVYERAT